MTLVNAEGLTIKSQQAKAGKTIISTSGMRTGIYFYNAQNSNGTISGKFSVQ
ncbi:T9SS type A sorting domain-containing protein [Chryseobacterium viscerum]|uniref:T9SS C-terminal target domain-containing protein n=1 Tax=Chryseobacterium viscerum TaxID=1037377 RepID=A0A316WNL9_9FLAO|nr:T9SS type A sorting domain-containing protein [Chryseobacterium viscerum]PWN62895.1 T9SS C-terminal target domain-containing protein [Chryseobacterium viscerum]